MGGFSSWGDALAYTRGAWAVMTETQRWITKAVVCLVAFFMLRGILGGPQLPFSLGGGGGGNNINKGHGGGVRGERRRARGGANGYPSEQDDYEYGGGGGSFGGFSRGTLGGVGTVASLGVLYVAYKNGASPYTLMMIAQMLGLGGGGRRRGMGGFGMGGMPYGMGGMGRRGMRGFF